MNTDYEQAVSRQRQAATPDGSVFVSANAGSGKTRVLVERVSRALLGGASPEKILCLTYTKAAASEMQDRLFERLGEWAILDDAALAEALCKLDGNSRPRSQKELGRARRLFARALETPGGLKVQTIHAFCERILKRFPLEAGIKPATDTIDDIQKDELQQIICREIEGDAVLEPESKIAKAIALLAAHKNDAAMDGLYHWMMQNIYKIEAWQESGGVDKLAEEWGVAPEETQESALAEFWQTTDRAQAEKAAHDMMASGTRDQGRGKPILAALAQSDPKKAFTLYRKAFLTAKDQITAYVPAKAASDFAKIFFGKGPDDPSPEALRVLVMRETIDRLYVLELTRAFHDLADLVTAKYQGLKSLLNVTDFDDQVYLTRKLLLDTHARDWVRYKLDGGASHILVDEAQDTSGAQWDIIDALAVEFFQPSPDQDPRNARTLFAVGDEKQSIYSFQGADPKLFLEKIQELTNKDGAASQVKMEMSFRSCAEILKLVDAVFYDQGGIKDMFDPDAFIPGSDVGAHINFRQEPGYIEFWPAAQAPTIDVVETPELPVPVDTPHQNSAREQLAAQVAVQIKTWIDDKQPVYAKKENGSGFDTRPMQARDIMILVTKRGAFFDGVIRHLKKNGVPVAGADKLKLGEALAVQDLLSLAKFVLLPSDDLALAELLKSPLFGWDEERLFELAVDRKGNLWSAMAQDRDKESLAALIQMSRQHAPYEFFARTLSMTTQPEGPSFLQKFYDRLGHECADALDGFLTCALAHQRRGAPSLGRFVFEMLSSEQIRSRVMDGEQNEVRVMTVHGAKGLEAPVVILPDSTQLPTATKDAVLPAGEGFVFNPGGKAAPAVFETIKQADKDRALRETMRLLYVALTRAESWLLLCGFESNKKVADGSWHDRVGRALGSLDGVSTTQTPFGDGLSYGSPPSACADLTLTETPSMSLPDWARKKAKTSAPSPRFFSPSKLDDTPKRPAPVGAGKPAALRRFGRGNLVHKLLEILPDLPAVQRKPVAQTYLQRQGLDADAAQGLLSEVFGVLDNPQVSFLFGETSRSEVSLAGAAEKFPPGVRFSGQIDRLAFVGNEVWIVDYKSNKNPPQDENEIPMLYVRQMAAYRELVREIYPDLVVKAALLWTDGAVLMSLSDASLDAVDWKFLLPS